MDQPVELQIFDFLEAAIAAAVDSDDPLQGLELHDTVYQTITQPNGIRISDSVGMFSPSVDGTAKEFDTLVVLVVFAKVRGKNKKDRATALQKVFEIQRAVCTLLHFDSSLGGRVCDSLVQRGTRGYDNFDGNPYAVANIPLVINPKQLGAF